ncbi:PD40 domain-containing protein [Parapedobacter indicus]|uniref:WD40-like Beta Propeller Repeat n=1 Tax=Parapedobacter indicus TaxID=1477437 RepID=A0A1I3F1R2_9SPHI|nr:PD40 domain-containing protein [Parapedobacter indicus]PPL03522.1 WD40 repeat protein [Parapedobacter indicus]SFI05179.1 WD40-like Beta Propeller Repeat [Parapedobacter indicus]
MKRIGFYLSLMAVLSSIANMGCSKRESHRPADNRAIKQGVLYYTAADELIRYDFQSKEEITLFSEGDHYRISPDAKQFIWYKNNFSDGTAHVQIHDLSTPSDYELVTIPSTLERTPQFIPGTSNFYAALVRAADGTIKREDLMLFNSDNNQIVGRIPHVKDFAVLPNGHDLVISAEVLDAQGEANGFALAVIKNFQSENGQESMLIHQYPDYTQLPTDISVSSNGQQIVFTHLDHLYTVYIQEHATPKQITQSRFREVDAAWSKDGKYIIFTGNTPDPSLDCGEIRIIPANPQNPILIPEDRANNEPVDPLQPIDTKEKSIHACGSEPYVWI